MLWSIYTLKNKEKIKIWTEKKKNQSCTMFLKTFSAMDWDEALLDFHNMAGITWAIKPTKTLSARRGRSFRGRWTLMDGTSAIHFLFCQCCYQFPKAAITRHHEVGGSKQQPFVPLQFQRPEVQSQSTSRTVFPLKALEENVSSPLSSFWCSLAILALPRLGNIPL